MLKLWILYNLLLSGFIFMTGLSGAKNIPQFLLPLLTLPLLYYLGIELLKKPKRKKIKESTVFADTLPSTSDPVLEGTPLDPNVSDDNRRLFLKLVGSTSLSILFMAVLGKGSAKAAFFGSMPGPGTVAIKDSAGNQIDPAEKQSTDGYEISEVDDSGTTSYYGFVHKTGAWYITKEDPTGGYRYAKGASAFATGWADRTTLTYDYFDAIF